MAENMSLADQAVQALAMVKAMDAGLDMEHPERHAVRNLQRLAEQQIAAGFRIAIDLAWQSKDLRKLVVDIDASAREIAEAKTQDGGMTPFNPLNAASNLPHNAKVSRSAPLLAQVGSTDGLEGAATARKP